MDDADKKQQLDSLEHFSTDGLRVYELFRRRIVEEDTLINNRISWLIWLQASIITAWGVIATGQNLRGVSKFYLLIFLNTFGFVMALTVLASIVAAHIEIRSCKRAYKSSFPSLYEDTRVPRITGNKTAHKLGHVVPLLAPFMFCLAQTVLIYSVIQLRLDADVSSATEGRQLPRITVPKCQNAGKAPERKLPSP